jgi:hypothetical protein
MIRLRKLRKELETVVNAAIRQGIVPLGVIGERNLAKLPGSIQPIKKTVDGKDKTISVLAFGSHTEAGGFDGTEIVNEKDGGDDRIGVPLVDKIEGLGDAEVSKYTTIPVDSADPKTAKLDLTDPIALKNFMKWADAFVNSAKYAVQYADLGYNLTEIKEEVEGFEPDMRVAFRDKATVRYNAKVKQWLPAILLTEKSIEMMRKRKPNAFADWWRSYRSNFDIRSRAIDEEANLRKALGVGPYASASSGLASDDFATSYYEREMARPLFKSPTPRAYMMRGGYGEFAEM